MHAPSFTRKTKVLAVSVVVLLSTMLCAGTAWADTFTVTNTSNSGAGSLREAINKANSRAGVDEIVFAEGVSGTITLGSQLEVTDMAGLTIDGGGDVTVSGNHAARVILLVEGAALSLRNLTVSDGSAVFSQFGGGGILTSFNSTLKLTNCILSGNSATEPHNFEETAVGGAIRGVGRVEVASSTFSDNHADNSGGAIFGGRLLEVTDSTFSGNHASDHGGAIYLNAENAEVEVAKSTFSDNHSRGVGGAIHGRGRLEVTDSTFSGNGSGGGGGILSGGKTEVANSTFFRNSARDAGGGIRHGGTLLRVTNSTFSGNQASLGGGGIFTGIPDSGTTTLRSTIMVNSTSGGNCASFGATLTDGGYNVADDDTCGFTQATGSLPNTDPLLDPLGLQDNGGPTQTIALQPNSAAVDLVGPEACPPPNTDQRGVARPQGEACDSGAYELVQGPQTKADCKKGGYKEFGFKNQGQCVASLQRKSNSG